MIEKCKICGIFMARYINVYSYGKFPKMSEKVCTLCYDGRIGKFVKDHPEEMFVNVL